MIGEKIKALRTSLNLTQEELALKAELDSTSICKIESDKANPSMKALVRLAKALNVTPSELLN